MANMEKIIEINSLNKISVIKKKNSCNHRNIEIDESKNCITCDECKQELNPIWWLARIAEQEQFYKWQVDLYEAKTKKINEHVKRKMS